MVDFPQLPTSLTYFYSAEDEMHRIDSGADSRFIHRQQTWDRPFNRYSLNAEILPPDALRDIKNFRRAIEFDDDNKENAFYFNDIDDNSVTATEFATGDGTENVFQLKKSYSVSDSDTGASRTFTFEVPHIKPDSVATITIKNGGSEVSNYTINHKSGVIIFDSAPANGNSLTATFEYWKKCIFDGSRPLSWEVPNPTQRNNSFDIIEVP